MFTPTTHGPLGTRLDGTELQYSQLQDTRDNWTLQYMHTIDNVITTCQPQGKIEIRRKSRPVEVELTAQKSKDSRMGKLAYRACVYSTLNWLIG